MWRFDLVTAFLTFVATPLLIAAGKYASTYLKRWLKTAFDAFLYGIGQHVDHALFAAVSLRRYCRLELEGTSKFLYVPSTHDIRLPTDSVYVPLSLEHSGTTQKIVSHEEALALGNRILVIGEPGSGKSTFAKRLLRDACRSGIKTARRAKLPFLLELKKLRVPASEGDISKWITDFISSELQRSAGYQMDKCFDTYAATSGLFLILDGLDEVATKDYPQVEFAINELSRHLSRLSTNNTIIVTMRTQFYIHVRDAYRESFSHSLFVQRFTPSDVYDFLVRWPFPSEAERYVSQIHAQLSDRPTLREMCSNPLVLAMYVAESESRRTTAVPESRTEFYRRVTEELLVYRRAQQLGRGPATTKLKEQRERILGELAYSHICDPEQPLNSLRVDGAVELIMKVSSCDRAAAENAFYEIAKETGLIVEERVGETYRFIHLTFCEFLAAYEAAEGSDTGWENLLTKHVQFSVSPETASLSSRLVEVIPFASGLLPRYRRSSAIDDVLMLNDNRLLARTLLETKAYDHRGFLKFVESESNSLGGVSDERSSEEWLRQLYLFTVVVRDAEAANRYVGLQIAEVDLDGILRSLFGTQKERFETVLSAYASQDAIAAFRLTEISGFDLAKAFPAIVIKNADQLPFLGIVQEYALRKDLGLVWVQLLAEAALRQNVVRTQLAEERIEVSLQARARSLPRSSKWWGGLGVSESRFTHFLSLAVHNSDQSPSECVLVKCLSRVPSPKQFRKRYFAALALCVLLLTTGALAARFILGPQYPETDGRLTLEFGMRTLKLAPFILPGYAGFIYLIYLNRTASLLYRTIMNPASTTNSNSLGNRLHWTFRVLMRRIERERVRLYLLERERAVR